MVLPRDFSEFVGLLHAHRVRYLVVGGYAVAFHGYPRYTGDLDVWLERSGRNARQVLKVLEAFGFGSLPITAADLTTPGQVIQLGYPPLRIDLLTDLEGVRFEACFARRVVGAFNGLELAVIGLECLRQNKRALGRAQDLADLEHLQEPE